MSKGKFILGGGLAGLITAYHNPEYTVITPETHGFIESKIGRAFVVIHEDDNTIKLFRELEVPSFRKRIRIRYYHAETGVTDAPPETFDREYIERKLPERLRPDDVQLGGTTGSEFTALFIDENIIDALTQEVDIRYGYASEVKDGSIVVEPSVGSTREFDYDALISTIPAPLFTRIIDTDLPWTLDHHPVTYSEMPEIPDRFFGTPWDYLYVVDDVPYHRVVRHVISNHYFTETLGNGCSIDTTTDLVNDYGVIASEDIDAPYGIQLIGRLAEWNPDILTNDVIKKAKTIQ